MTENFNNNSDDQSILPQISISGNLPDSSSSTPSLLRQPMDTSVFGTSKYSNNFEFSPDTQNKAVGNKIKVTKQPRNSTPTPSQELIRALKNEYYSYSLPENSAIPLNRQYFFWAMESSYPFIDTVSNNLPSKIPRLPMSPSWWFTAAGARALNGNYSKELVSAPQLYLTTHVDNEPRVFTDLFTTVYTSWQNESQMQARFNINRWSNPENNTAAMVNFFSVVDMFNTGSSSPATSGSLTLYGYSALSNYLKYLQPYDCDISWMLGGAQLRNDNDLLSNTPLEFLTYDLNDHDLRLVLPDALAFNWMCEDHHNNMPEDAVFQVKTFDWFLNHPARTYGETIADELINFNYTPVFVPEGLSSLAFLLCVAMQISSTPIRFIKNADLTLCQDDYAPQSLNAYPGEVGIYGLNSIWDCSTYNLPLNINTNLINGQLPNNQRNFIAIVMVEQFNTNPVTPIGVNEMSREDFVDAIEALSPHSLEPIVFAFQEIWLKTRDFLTVRELYQISDLCAALRTRYWSTCPQHDASNRTQYSSGAYHRFSHAGSTPSNFNYNNAPGVSDEHFQKVTPDMCEGLGIQATTPNSLQCSERNDDTDDFFVRNRSFSASIPQFSGLLFGMIMNRWVVDPKMLNRVNEIKSDPVVGALYSSHDVLIPWLIHKSSLMAIGTDTALNINGASYEYQFTLPLQLQNIWPDDIQQYRKWHSSIDMIDKFVTPAASNLASIKKLVVTEHVANVYFARHSDDVEWMYHKHSSWVRDHTLKSPIIFNLMVDYLDSIDKKSLKRQNILELKRFKYGILGFPVKNNNLGYRSNFTSFANKTELGQMFVDSISAKILIFESLEQTDSYGNAFDTSTNYWDKYFLPLHLQDELQNWYSLGINRNFDNYNQWEENVFAQQGVWTMWHNPHEDSNININPSFASTWCRLPIPFFISGYSTQNDKKDAIVVNSLMSHPNHPLPSYFTLLPYNNISLSMDMSSITGDGDADFDF